MDFAQKVNSKLAESISVINAMVAVGYPILTGLVSGILLQNIVPGDFSLGAFLFGLIFGGLGGLVFVGIVCGLLAVLIDIRNSLARGAAGSQGG